jgi:tRNA(Ile)-lysidine synthase
VPIALETLSVDTQGNLEDAARRVRYDFFARHMASGDVLMLAHHGQDQLETILMRLFQGRGVLPMRRHGSLGQGVLSGRLCLGQELFAGIP